MPTPPLPTRQQVDAAQPLDFAPAPPREQRTTIRIEIAPDGLRISVEYTGTLGSIPAAVERLRAAGVLDLVKPAPVAQQARKPAQQQRKPAERVEPEYNSAGEPLCPVHHKPLKQGQWGLYCPAKDDTTERGYCSLKFID